MLEGLFTPQAMVVSGCQTSATPEDITCTNITSAIASDPLRLTLDRHWQLLAQLKMGARDLLSLNGLRQLIREAHGGRSLMPAKGDARPRAVSYRWPPGSGKAAPASR